MQKKRILILGAGISGLATAWYLSKAGLPLEITLLEKTARAGGWIHTDHTTGFHFEKGPRTFRVEQCPSTMQLIAELGLQEEIVWSEARPHHRYLWLEGELQRFPTNPLAFLFSPLTRGFLRALLTEWRRPTKSGDETVWEFVVRRFNYDVARLFFDPMVVGIFGGDIRQISVRACFPRLKAWEQQYGSVTRGFYHRMRAKSKMSPYSTVVPNIPLSAMFSFRRGLEQLPQSILRQTSAAVHYNQEALEITCASDQVVVKTQDNRWEADYLFCALPVKETARLFESHVPDIAKEFSKVPSESLAVVSFGYDAQVLPVQGFGYLTPSYAHEDILGVVFDSSVFVEHNRSSEETRLTIKMQDSGRAEEKYIELAMSGIRRHLGISRVPKAISFKRAQRAIPQYGVGHLEKMVELSEQFVTRLPLCQLVGNYLQGVSVDQCIARAKDVVSVFLKSQDASLLGAGD